MIKRLNPQGDRLSHRRINCPLSEQLAPILVAGLHCPSSPAEGASFPAAASVVVDVAAASATAPVAVRSKECY